MLADLAPRYPSRFWIDDSPQHLHWGYSIRTIGDIFSQAICLAVFHGTLYPIFARPMDPGSDRPKERITLFLGVTGFCANFFDDASYRIWSGTDRCMVESSIVGNSYWSLGCRSRASSSLFAQPLLVLQGWICPTKDSIKERRQR